MDQEMGFHRPILMGRNRGYKVSDRGLIIAFSAFQTLLHSLPEVCAEGAERVVGA